MKKSFDVRHSLLPSELSLCSCPLPFENLLSRDLDAMRFDFDSEEFLLMADLNLGWPLGYSRLITDPALDIPFSPFSIWKKLVSFSISSFAFTID